MLCFKNDSVFYSIVRLAGYKEEPTRVTQIKKNCWNRLKCKMGMAVGWLRKLENKGRGKWWKGEETWKLGSEGGKNT